MRLLEWFSGCTHSRTSFPIKQKLDSNAHVTCLDCGREWDYDWETMQRSTPRPPAAERAEVQPETEIDFARRLA